MKLDFSLEELRVVSQLADQVQKNPIISAMINKKDLAILLSVAGKFRAMYEMEKEAKEPR